MVGSTYCDLPREFDIAHRLTLAEHIIDAFSSSLDHRVLIKSSACRWERKTWGLYVYATIQLYDHKRLTTPRGMRFRATDTFVGIQGGSAHSNRFIGPPPADAPTCPAADVPHLAELNAIL